MRSHQAGVSLPVVLALLLGMALLGATVLQSGLLHTRMAADAHARDLAFQAAESALRAGEEIAASAPPPPASGCSGGLCAMPDASAMERWRQPGFSGWQALAGGQGIGLPAAQFIIEWMGDAPATPGCERETPLPETCLRPLYRITARSAGARATVLVQAHYLGERVSWREMEP